MSPASKAKSKDKKAGKDPQKASVKPSGLVNMGSGTPVSGYNPLLGKFHTIETAPYSSLQVNGRFRNIDEDDYSGSSGGNGMEYDTLSNNGSWSGESEDHKDKTTNPLRQEASAAPGVGADSDKREKIRQKNERKHQRQKERRALELHERCNGFLMSRKLESLAQQLVSMGFSQERATMALISNEGKMEESVSWLFEGGAGDEAFVDTLNKEHLNLDAGNLKIDISDELARIADMEIRYKCSRQEVERAIVTCEGDLDKAADTLRVQKQVSLSSPSPKPDETGDPPTLTNDKLSLPNNSQNSLRLQPKPIPSTLLQQKRDDDKDFNYTKAAVATNGVIVPSEQPGSKNVQVLRKPQTKVEWTKSQQQQQIVTPVDKRNQQQQQVSSYSLSSQLQVVQAPTAKAEARYTALGSEIKNLQLGLVKEPVVVMQRPQSANAKQVSATSISSSSPPNNAVAASSGGWYPNHAVELVKPNGLHIGLSPHIVPSTRNSSVNNMSSSNQLFSQQLHYQQQYQQHPPQYVSNNNGMMMGNGMWNRMGGGLNTTNTTTPTLAVASSLGLFTGMGSNGSSGSSSPVDWKTGGSMVELDYANIDWSLDRSSRPNSGMWNAHGYDAYTQGLNMSRTTTTTTTMRPLANNMSSNVQDGGAGDLASSSSSGETSAAAGAREWSSPFEEKDIFSLPRQFVFSPSL